MSYEQSENFDSIESAFEFITSELRNNIDNNRVAILESEKNAQKAQLLQEQIDGLTIQANGLIKNIAGLEGKQEVVKRELREHVDKVTKRLEKERADFEEVRIKRRTELEEREKLIDNREQGLDQRESKLELRETDIIEREKVLNETENSFAMTRGVLVSRERELEEEKTAHTNRVASENKIIAQSKMDLEALIAAKESNISKKLTETDRTLREAEDYKDNATKMMVLAENKLKSIEKIAENQKSREEQLNLKQSNLIAMEKALSTRKIQLDDREAVIKSH